MSVIRNSVVVRYSGVAIVIYIWRRQSVHVPSSVIRYMSAIGSVR